MILKVAVVLLFSCLLSNLRVDAREGYAYAEIESCAGCTLRNIPDVKKFIFEDVPHYDRVKYKQIQGAIPELVLYDSSEKEIERLVLSRLTREECNDLLLSKGFKRIIPLKDEV